MNEADIQKMYVRALRSVFLRHRKLLRIWEKVERGEIEPPQYYTDTGTEDKWRAGFLMQLIRDEHFVDELVAALRQTGVAVKLDMRRAMESAYAEARSSVIDLISDKLGAEVAGGFAVYNERMVRAVMREEQPPFSKIAFRNLGRQPAMVSRINAAFGAAIAAGEGAETMTARIMRTAGYPAIYQARRTFQTEMTRVSAQATQDALDEAAAMGIRTYKKWVRNHRKDSRDSHRELDGKMVYSGKDFKPGLGRPGDPRAPAGEVINCCCMLVEGVLLDDEAISPDGRSIVRKMGSVLERSDKLPEGQKGLPKGVVSGILSVPASEQLHQKIKSGYFPMKLRKIQDRHTYGETWRELVRKGQYKGVFARGTDVEELIRKYAGTVSNECVQLRANGTFTKFVTLTKNVGRAYSVQQGKYLAAHKIAIRYSRKGVHAYPVLEIGE